MAASPDGERSRTELAVVGVAELRHGEASTSGRDAPVHPVIARAAALLTAGDVVAIPTETVYGLAANALSASAVEKVYAAKNRPADNPLIVHVSSLEMLASLFPDGWSLPPIYQPIVRDLWPGPLTILLPRSPRVPDVVTCGMPTMAVRMPSHPVALALISACGFPLAAPSANSSGRPSPTLARHVLDDLDGAIQLVLDGGPCTCGVESTVLDGLRSPPAILRPGGVTRERLAAFPGLEGLQVYRRDFVDAALEAAPTTPGMKYRHYSPRAPVLLLDPGPGPAPGPAAERPPGPASQGGASGAGASACGGCLGGAGDAAAAAGGEDGSGDGDAALAARLRQGVAALLSELAAEAAASPSGHGGADARPADAAGCSSDAASGLERVEEEGSVRRAATGSGGREAEDRGRRGEPAAAPAPAALTWGLPLVVGVLRTSVARVPAGPLQPATTAVGDATASTGAAAASTGTPCNACDELRASHALSSAATASPCVPPVGGDAASDEGAASPSLPSQQQGQQQQQRRRLVVLEYVLGHVSGPEGVATELFAALRWMDQMAAGAIVVEGVRDEGAGVAVMNRLRKAASRVVPV